MKIPYLAIPQRLTCNQGPWLEHGPFGAFALDLPENSFYRWRGVCSKAGLITNENERLYVQERFGAMFPKVVWEGCFSYKEFGKPLNAAMAGLFENFNKRGYTQCVATQKDNDVIKKNLNNK